MAGFPGGAISMAPYYQSILALFGDRTTHVRLHLGESPAEETDPLNLEKPTTAPADVWAFAVKWRFAKHLAAVLEMTPTVFPGCETELVLEDDPELAGDRYIVVNVRGVTGDQSAAMEARRAWGDGLRAVCPGLEAYLFRLSLEIAD